MLLARGSVKKAFKTARVCQIRHAPLNAFLYSPRIQNHYAKSGNWGFSERTLEACTNLSWEVRLLRERGGDRSIGKANLRKGLCPFNGSAPRTLQWLARPMPGRRTLRPLHPKSLRQIGELWFSEPIWKKWG